MSKFQTWMVVAGYMIWSLKQIPYPPPPPKYALIWTLRLVNCIYKVLITWLKLLLVNWCVALNSIHILFKIHNFIFRVKAFRKELLCLGKSLTRTAFHCISISDPPKANSACTISTPTWLIQYNTMHILSLCVVPTMELLSINFYQ